MAGGELGGAGLPVGEGLDVGDGRGLRGDDGDVSGCAYGVAGFIEADDVDVVSAGIHPEAALDGVVEGPLGGLAVHVNDGVIDAAGHGDGGGDLDGGSDGGCGGGSGDADGSVGRGAVEWRWDGRRAGIGRVTGWSGIEGEGEGGAGDVSRAAGAGARAAAGVGGSSAGAGGGRGGRGCGGGGVGGGASAAGEEKEHSCGKGQGEQTKTEQGTPREVDVQEDAHSVCGVARNKRFNALF